MHKVPKRSIANRFSLFAKTVKRRKLLQGRT